MPTIGCEIKKEAYEILKARLEKEGKSVNQFLRGLVYREIGFSEAGPVVEGSKKEDPGTEKKKKTGFLSFWG